MGGHATHDEREARDTFPPDVFAAWGQRDPVGQYEEYLKEEGVTAVRLGEVEAEVTVEIEGAERAALASRERMPGAETALGGVYHP